MALVTGQLRYSRRNRDHSGSILEDVTSKSFDVLLHRRGGSVDVLVEDW
jgi:hypothetical protein